MYRYLVNPHHRVTQMKLLVLLVLVQAALLTACSLYRDWMGEGDEVHSEPR